MVMVRQCLPRGTASAPERLTSRPRRAPQTAKAESESARSVQAQSQAQAELAQQAARTTALGLSTTWAEALGLGEFSHAGPMF